jgi:hypothetical protein
VIIQPRLHTIIEQSEISKAIFSELKGNPHYFRIDSNSSFEFYAGITVPKIDGCPLSKKFSFEVLDANFPMAPLILHSQTPSK